MIQAVAVPPGAAGEAYDHAATTIRCDCGCPAQSVKECACERAEEMRQAIASDAAAGKPGDAIVASYVARYGEKILLVPAASGFNLVAWAAPGLLLILAAAAVVALVRRWLRRTAATVAAAPPAPRAAQGDDAYYARLAKDLEEMR